MTKKAIDADAILNRARPLVHQQTHEIHPYGHLVKLPIALSEDACKESVDNLNELLANTMTLCDHSRWAPCVCRQPEPGTGRARPSPRARGHRQ